MSVAIWLAWLVTWGPQALTSRTTFDTALSTRWQVTPVLSAESCSPEILGGLAVTGRSLTGAHGLADLREALGGLAPTLLELLLDVAAFLALRG
jgi:hypothetical protein